MYWHHLEGLVKTQSWAPPPEFLIREVWMRPENVHSKQASGDADAAGVGTPL